MTFRTDEIRHNSMEAEALARLRAEQAARATLDREAARRDADQRWAAQQVAKARPEPRQGMQRAAQVAMVRRVSPGWTPPPVPTAASAAAAWRMDAAPARAGISSAAEARALMEQRSARSARWR